MPDNPRDDLIEILESLCRAQLQALRRLRRSAAREPAPASGPRTKRMSQIDMVHDILRGAKGPLHISEILTRVAKRYGVTLDRESVVSALAKRVARKDRFIRAGANTFALLPDNER